MSKTSAKAATEVAAIALSRIVTADSSVIEEGKLGSLPSDEFETLRGLGYVRKPTAEELKAAEGEPAAAPAPAPSAE